MELLELPEPLALLGLLPLVLLELADPPWPEVDGVEPLVVTEVPVALLVVVVTPLFMV